MNPPASLATPAPVSEPGTAPPRRPPKPGDAGLWRRLTARWRLWPDFLILGTQRGGTTSLFRALEQHPNVIGSTRKELHFFDYQFARGPNWYRAHFPTVFARQIRRRTGCSSLRTGEATPYYLACPQAPRRAFGTVPGARLIVLLRDPTERAWSHYRMARWQGRETLSFADALAAEDERLRGEYEKLRGDHQYYSRAYHQQSYRTRGVYLRQLLDWLEWYPRQQLLVLRSEDFYREPAAVYAQVCQFLGLPDWRPPGFVPCNVQSEKPLPEPTRTELAEYFRPHNAALASFLGRDLDWAS